MTAATLLRRDRASDHGTPGWVAPVVVTGLVIAVVAALLAVLVPLDGPVLAATLAGGGVVTAGLAFLLVHRPWLAPWFGILLFATSAELRLRVSPTIGLAKDAYVLLLLLVLVVWLVRRHGVLGHLRVLLPATAALGVLVFLYLLDPAGTHGTQWIAGTRLLLEPLVLLAVGVLLAPRRTMRHLVASVVLVLPLEAAFAWAQQFAGEDRLVYVWGYEFGSQVRLTTGGGLRTSGTFEDPFQLAALAVLGLALALFVASRWQAVVLVASGIAVLAATSVRTALIQVGLLLLILAVRRGWGRPAAVLAALGAVVAVVVLATTRSAAAPGAQEEPLLLTLNGRSTAWALAVEDAQGFVTGNGVGVRGVGSTRTDLGVSAPPTFDPTSSPTALFAGNPAFLDSSYAQVQSDVGMVGTIALLAAIGCTTAVIVRRCRASYDGAAWAAGAVLATSAVDWIGRSSLPSYTTGFLTLYVLGVLLGASLAEREQKGSA